MYGIARRVKVGVAIHMVHDFFFYNAFLILKTAFKDFYKYCLFQKRSTGLTPSVTLFPVPQKSSNFASANAHFTSYLVFYCCSTVVTSYLPTLVNVTSTPCTISERKKIEWHILNHYQTKFLKVNRIPQIEPTSHYRWTT